MSNTALRLSNWGMGGEASLHYRSHAAAWLFPLLFDSAHLALHRCQSPPVLLGDRRHRYGHTARVYHPGVLRL